MRFTLLLSFLKQVFSDNGSPSASRLLTLLHSLVTCACLIYVTVHNHAIPDGMTLTGLGAFATAPYAINRASVVFGKDTPSKSDVLLAQSIPPVSPTKV